MTWLLQELQHNCRLKSKRSSILAIGSQDPLNKEPAEVAAQKRATIFIAWPQPGLLNQRERDLLLRWLMILGDMA